MTQSVNSEDTITVPMGTLLRRDTDEWSHIPATLSYSKSDPFAVSATFRPENEVAQSWTWARELLIGGLEDAAGEADVIVYPGEFDDVIGYTAIYLASPGFEETVYAPTSAVSEFITRSLKLVPEGQESEYLDIDGTIARLLA